MSTVFTWLTHRGRMLTIAYLTSRRESRIEWFFDSLRNQLGGDWAGIQVVIVDFHQEESESRWRSGPDALRVPPNAIWVPPKPNVWQGPHRLTTRDYFAPSNARNTALCYTPDEHIAFVDDLSVLMPGWLSAVREAIKEGYIGLGAYMKVRKLVVENGNVVSFEPFPLGVDSRWESGNDHTPVRAAGSWMYGCSVVGPVEAFLKIGGFPEVCDSLGGEDYIAGMMMEKQGEKFKYDRRLLTYESEEGHHQLPQMLREDPCHGDPNAKPRNDMSHAALKTFTGSSHPGYWEEGGIRSLRQKILAGGSFPIVQHPQHRWFDKKPLAEM